MGKWNNRSRFHRRRSPMRWYSDRHSSSSSSYYGYGEDDGIPVWEKKFCEVIGSVPWQKVVEASSFKSWYQGNVITWDDSACQETFHNEKKRFWSRFNGIHCDISAPDPDLYISEVDWDTTIDPELIRDVERAYFAPPDDLKIGCKRGRRDKDWSDCNLVPIEETRVLDISLENSNKVHDVNALGKKCNGWDILESSTDHPKDRERPWGGNEKANDTNEMQWKTKGIDSDNWESSGQRNVGWDKAEQQNKKARGSESVPDKQHEMLDNPWEAESSCRKETSKDTTWGGRTGGNGWEDRGWDNDCWGGGVWDNRGSGNQVRERKEWCNKRYSQNFREPKGYNNQWKVGFVTDNAASREYGANAGGWQTRRASETNRRNWDARRSSDGWGRRNREKDDLYGYNSNYKNSRPTRR